MPAKNVIQKSLDSIEKCNAKRSLYYEKYYHESDLRQLGAVQSEKRSRPDKVSLDHNELVHFFGFTQSDGSHFELTMEICALPHSENLATSVSGPERRRKLSPALHLASAKFVLYLANGDGVERTRASGHTTRCSYEHEALLDYEEKSRNNDKHENANIYKIGDLLVEINFPFSLSRIFFNGLMKVEAIPTGENNHSAPPSPAATSFRPVKLTLSTHPTCDKFVYRERFNRDFVVRSLAKAKIEISEDQPPVAQLLKLLQEFRIDQPLMFQGHLEDLAAAAASGESDSLSRSFIMWGAKVKEQVPVEDVQGLKSEQRFVRTLRKETLFAWSECGQQVHLTRLCSRPGFVIGLAHSSFDYASPLYDLQLYKRARKVANGSATGDAPAHNEVEDDKQQVELEQMEFGELKSFGDLTSEHVIQARAFRVKEYTIEFDGERLGAIRHARPARIKLNKFNGWALSKELDLGEQAYKSQQLLWTVSLHDEQYTPLVARETLLGGKGNSLVELARMLRTSPSFGRREVSVPRGLVVTTEAYQLWLTHGAHRDRLASALHELDCLRLKLAAKSIHQDPMSSGYVSPGVAQRSLSEQCEKTRAEILSCALPEKLRAYLRAQLGAIFGGDVFNPDGATTGPMGRKLFAVRSSCVGEDSLETSAAGQMKTILDASSFESICEALLECWASQFSPEALTYKSQNGLAFNLPMAVVVQELVPCHAAGVAATCDPLTGNRCRLEITANLGLGEGVVAGKATDTVRVTLDGGRCVWDARREEFHLPSGQRELTGNLVGIEKVAVGSGGRCCLSDAQILALANLLLEVRRANPVGLRDREVEWGLTLAGGDGVSNFRLHLLQSRPLTHLRRLSTREIDHELDSGLPCFLDSVSRANLGEVMPGAMCPLNSSWFWAATTANFTRKPYEPIGSRQIYVAETFAYHARMLVMVVTSADSISRFRPPDMKEPTVGEDGTIEDPNDTTARDVVYSMIGSTFTEPKDEDELKFRQRFLGEKMNPLAQREGNPALRVLLALATGRVRKLRARRALDSLVLQEDLTPIDQLAEERRSSERKSFEEKLFKQIRKLYDRLLTQTSCLSNAWFDHVMATLTSMALNTAVLKMMCAQPAYKGRSMIATEVLNDFSVLVRGPPETSLKLGSATESGDISKLLEHLLECFVEENLLDSMKALSLEELYRFLNEPKLARKFRSCHLYTRFMRKNGHRAYKEFDLATKCWADDQTYILRLLQSRLKSYTLEERATRREKQAENSRRQAQQLAQVEAKLSEKRFAITRLAVPQARQSTITREGSKSMLIRAIHKYRRAFRHLGGLLCLAGLLPSADLIFYLALEELDEVVRRCCLLGPAECSHNRSDVMPRLLYKARRRQQRTRAYDQVRFPRPTIPLAEMLESIREQTEQSKAPMGLPSLSVPQESDPAGRSAHAGEARVEGITSCAGCVTGRACVVASIEEAHQLEPNDILITYSIDISWSVYFYQLAGIVTEVGGIVSHGAVVAREYGLPTLCTAVGACSRFQTGQMVTLDASRGVCYLVAPAANRQQTGSSDKERGESNNDDDTGETSQTAPSNNNNNNNNDNRDGEGV